MKKKISKMKLMEHIQAYSFLAPTIFIIGVFVYVSIFFAIFLSFNKVSLLSMSFNFVGLDNYARLFNDTRLVKAFTNTIAFVLVVAPLQTIIALVLAAVLNSKIKAQNVFRLIYFLPTLTSSVALTMIFMFLFSIDGPVNIILLALGTITEKVNWLNEAKVALKIIMSMNIWSTVPFYITIYLAALQDIPKAQYEAAEVDGATVVQKFFHVTVPYMRPITTFVIITSIIGTFQMFDQAYIFSNGSGGPQNSTLTVALMVYQYAFGMMNTMGYATAIALLLAVVILIVSLIAKRLNKSESLY